MVLDEGKRNCSRTMRKCLRVAQVISLWATSIGGVDPPYEDWEIASTTPHVGQTPRKSNQVQGETVRLAEQIE